MPKVSRPISKSKKTPTKCAPKKITKVAASKEVKKSKASEFSIAKKDLVSLPAIDMTDSEE